eukprot:s4178_g3.t1
MKGDLNEVAAQFGMALRDRRREVGHRSRLRECERSERHAGDVWNLEHGASDNPAALQAAQNVITSFESGTPWSQCFSSVRAFDAKLTAQEDVYDAWAMQNFRGHFQFKNHGIVTFISPSATPATQSEGYAARNDWANGPNSVFLFVMRSFGDGTFGNYDAFYFMEFDAVPVRGNWLHQFVAEAYDETVAIRGSRYRGVTKCGR